MTTDARRSGAARRRVRLIGPLAALAASALPLLTGPVPASAAPPGATALDPSFGMGGMVTATVGADDRAMDVASLPDGGLIVAGHTDDTPGPGGDSGLFVRRYSAAGQVDPSFGDNGTFLLDDPAAYEVPYAVAVQPDGRIVVAGTAGGRPTVIRLTSAGQLDPEFQGGIVRVTAVETGYAVGPAIQPDGKIVFGGFGVAVGRLLPDGRLDQDFASGGIVPKHYDYPVVEPTSVVLQPDGRILVGGSNAGFLVNGGSTEEGVIVRYTPAGVQDTTFGTNGVVSTSLDTEYVDRTLRFQALVVQPDGKIVGAGRTETYPGPPPTPTPNGPPPGQPNTFMASTNLALVHYNPDGRLDRTFAGSGSVITRMPGHANPHHQNPAADIVAYGGSSARTVALDEAGRIVVAGWKQQGELVPMVARFTPSGLLDTTFGRGGALPLDLGGREGQFNAVALAPDGGIVAGGRTSPFLEENDSMFLARVVPGTSQGSVWTWGWNAVGQLGDGTAADRHQAVKVPGLSGVVAVSAGTYHTVALRGDGTVWAWGWNGVGQLGDGTLTDRARPVRVPGLSGIVAVAAGGLHSLALSGDGTVYGWGWNGVGQLGDGTVVTRVSPSRVVGLKGAIAVSAGSFHSLAVREDGSAWAWGWNAGAQLGDGTTVDRAVPVRLAEAFAGQPFFVLSAGALHSLAVVVPMDHYGWGWNGVGQVNTLHPEWMESGLLNRTTLHLTQTLALSAGGYHSLALHPDGRVSATGWNVVGQLGIGTTTPPPYGWASVVGLEDVADVSAGAYHSAALTADRRVYMWGWNGVGQLGTGMTVDAHRPVRTITPTNAVAVSAGGAHTVAIKA